MSFGVFYLVRWIRRILSSSNRRIFSFSKRRILSFSKKGDFIFAKTRNFLFVSSKRGFSLSIESKIVVLAKCRNPSAHKKIQQKVMKVNNIVSK